VGWSACKATVRGRPGLGLRTYVRTYVHPHTLTRISTKRQRGGTAAEVGARAIEAVTGLTGATMGRAAVAAKTHERDRAAIGHRYAVAA